MPTLKAKIGGAWVPIAGPGSGADEVFVGANDPGAAYELWYDTDDPGVSLPNLPRGYVAHAVSGVATASIGATVTDITGTSCTFTADPTRRYKTTMVSGRIDQFAATGQAFMTIADASNNNLAYNYLTLGGGAFGFIAAVHLGSGWSGTQTRKARANTSAGTINVQGNTWIIVEDIGGV